MGLLTAIVIGAGNRGSTYAGFARDEPEQLKIVGVVDPRKFRREKLVTAHNVPSSNVFEDWKEVCKRPKFADCVFICTPDKQHKDPAVAFAKLGYHVLLEKPMAVTYEDCKEIVEVCESNKVMLAVCHVLRYTPQSQKIKSLIADGVIGEVVNIQLLEPVGFWHFAHSYVRGNWRNEGESTFSLLAKSCHDLDLIVGWMGDRKCTKISSFGSLKHFKKENKPTGAGNRCLDCGVESSCQYSAKKIYLDPVRQGYCGWPVHVLADVPDIESITKALQDGPYGRCVYGCDNDVCDNQVVNMEFEGGTTASFTMVAFTEKICARQVKIFGTKGELSCDFDRPVVQHFDFLTKDRLLYDLNKEHEMIADSKLRGHFGADFFTITSFLEAVRSKNEKSILTGARESLLSHQLCFMAEKSRLESRTITL